MKEMEAKTENRYEYRKPQEKRKQMIAPNLFEFAYVPDWYGHLAELERLALPESWKFRKPSRETKNTDTPILERYIHTIFRKQVIDFNSESDPRTTSRFLRMEHCWWCSWTERRLNVKMKRSKKRCRLGVVIPDRLFFLLFCRW